MTHLIEQSQYEFLLSNSYKKPPYNTVENIKPNFSFSFKDYKTQEKYRQGFSVNTLFKTSSVGIVTARDNFTIHESPQLVKNTIEKFLSIEDEDEARKLFDLGKDVRDWKVKFAKQDLKESGPDFNRITKISYRPFDIRFTYYTGNSKGFHCMPRGEVMNQFFKKENIGLVTARSNKSNTCDHFFLSKNLVEAKFGERTTQSATFPLYLYPEESTQQTLDGQPERTPNLDKKIVQEIAEKLGLKFTPEKEDSKGTFAPIDLLDYIYAVLHSPSYREKYKEFLKIDFPRVPYPEDPEQFWQLVELGGELRQIHLLEHPVVEDFITTYPESGSNIISNRLTKNDPGFVVDEEEGGTEELKASKGKILRRYQDDSEDDLELGKVWINEEQYFGNVPKKAWEFYIGGYQPAEKWLKDRRYRELTFEEIQHYQKIIVALMETDRIMGEIDGVWGE